MSNRSCVALIALLFMWSGPASAAPTVSIQGVFKTLAGVPVTDGEYALTIRFYAAEDSTEPLYEEIQPGIPVVNGVVSATVGANIPLSPAVFSAGDVWIGVGVDAEPELARVPVHWVPYAMVSSVAHTVDCTGCITQKQLAVDLDFVTPEALALALADKATKTELTEALAGYPTQADLTAALAPYATTASLGAYLPLAGGTLSGKLTLEAGLDLSGTLAEGLRLESVAPASIACDAAQRGRLIIDSDAPDLVYCDGAIWRRLSGCEFTCPDPLTALCGQALVDGCGTTCTDAGTALNTAQCAPPDQVACGEQPVDACQNACPGAAGTQCPSGQVCDTGKCVALSTLGYVSGEGAPCDVDDDWFDCNKDPNNADCNPPGTKIQGENDCAFANKNQGTALEACKCIISPLATKAVLVPNVNGPACTVYACQ